MVTFRSCEICRGRLYAQFAAESRISAQWEVGRFTATLRLKQSLERYVDQPECDRRDRSKLKKADKNQVPRTRRTPRTD